MIDKSRDPQKNKTETKLALLHGFAAVPRRNERWDGWIEERQRGFIEALADLGSVRAAANAVNMTPESAYQLRRHPEAGEFRKAWEAALMCGVQRLEDVAMDRALNGVEEDVYHDGEVVGQRTCYDNRLLMFMLRNRLRKRFAADSWQNADAATKSQLERLRKQWREEWESERAVADAQSEQEVYDSIDAMIDEMRARAEAMRSPRVKALYAEIKRVEEEEREAGYLPFFDDEDEDEDWNEEMGATGPHSNDG